jgi:hypothetical protein
MKTNLFSVISRVLFSYIPLSCNVRLSREYFLALGAPTPTLSMPPLISFCMRFLAALLSEFGLLSPLAAEQIGVEFASTSHCGEITIGRVGFALVLVGDKVIAQAARLAL